MVFWFLRIPSLVFGAGLNYSLDNYSRDYSQIRLHEISHDKLLTTNSMASCPRYKSHLWFGFVFQMNRFLWFILNISFPNIYLILKLFWWYIASKTFLFWQFVRKIIIYLPITNASAHDPTLCLLYNNISLRETIYQISRRSQNSIFKKVNGETWCSAVYVYTYYLILAFQIRTQ